MNNLKVATIFSGIGAPEYALKRLGIKYSLIFACDNGDRLIDANYEIEFNKIKRLNNIQKKLEYVEDLYKSKTRRTNFVEQSFKANHNPIFFFQDVKLLDGTDFTNQIDLFIGGSPCQSFSIIGKQGGFKDTRGTLFYDYARLVQEIQPKIFIYENVANVINHDGGRTWNTMLNTFNELGYDYSYSILNSKDFGIPQSRKRIFVVGFRKNILKCKFKFPEPIRLKYSMQDFLEENCAIGSLLSVRGVLRKMNKKRGIPEEKYFLSPKLLKYCLSPGTKNFYHPNIEIDLPIARALLSTMGNSHRASVNNYVTTDGRVRALTTREALRLMGFPDDYKIVVSKAQTYKQAGNSIVVDVMIHIIKQIYKAMGWSYGKN